MKKNKMNYSYTISILSVRVKELQAEIEKSEKAMEEPELMADIIWGEADVYNFSKQIAELQTAIQHLYKLATPTTYGNKKRKKAK